MAKANVYVTLKPALLDAQGKVVQGALENLGFKNVQSVRIGKFIEIELSEEDDNLEQAVDEMCRKLLANPNTETYRFEINRSLQ
jgi:phosphoribosylformylglycinamidine synthase